MEPRRPHWKDPLSLAALVVLIAGLLVLLFGLRTLAVALLVVGLALNSVAITRRATRGTVGKWYAPELPPQ